VFKIEQALNLRRRDANLDQQGSAV